MKDYKVIILSAYGLILTIVTLLFVPVYEIWGSQEKYVEGLEYHPIWILMNNNHIINGFSPRYELCIDRCIYQIVILTMIAVVIYLIFHSINKNKQSNN